MINEKVVLITGASRGLGYALAKTLASQGYCVYAGMRELKNPPEGTIPVWLDLTQEVSLHLCIKKILLERTKIDILINNGAIAYVGGVDTMTLQEAKNLFDINFFGSFRLTQLVLPHMREKKSGRIFFISSIRGIESCAYMGMYAASKAALEAMAFDWAVTLKKWNISVSVIQPGPMDTGIELQHGTYYADSKDNPYFPYGEVSLVTQPVGEVCMFIAEQLALPSLPFRLQTSEASRLLIEKHLRDPSGNIWYNEQKFSIFND